MSRQVCCPDCGEAEPRFVIQLPATFKWDGVMDLALLDEHLVGTEFPIEDGATVVCNDCDWTGRVYDLQPVAAKVQPEITLHVQPEDDIPVRGNAMASGDDAYDKEVEDEIIRRLEGGDVWAWAKVEVRATYKGLYGSAFLGACSYKDEKGFKEAGGYYGQMVGEACRELQDLIDKVGGAKIEVPA
jgi:hypothetical protein